MDSRTVGNDALFRGLLESAPDALVIVNAAGAIVLVNSQAEQMFGYSRAEMRGELVDMLVPDRFRPHHTGHRAGYSRAPKVRAMGPGLELFGLRKNGEEFPVEISLSPLDTGTETLVITSIRDVTERKRIERVLHERTVALELANLAALRAGELEREVNERKRADQARQTSEERYRALFEYAPDGILIADPQSYYLDANASMCTMLGYSREELIGLHASDIVAPVETPFIDEALQAINETHDYQREWQFRRKDGSFFRADVIATVMPDGNILAMIHDLTGRIKAEEARRSAEERMRFALQSARVGIWDMDYTTGALRWSDIIEGQYGLEPGTFAGTFEAFVERIHPADRDEIMATVGQAMATGTKFFTKHRALWPNGTVRWLEGAGQVYLGADGAPVRATGISLDITERRSLEEQFQQAQKMEAVGRLAGGVAHDFNNLLTVILGYCELLGADISTDDPRQVQIAEIHKAGLSAAGLTRQLLAFSRKEIVEPTLLDLNDVATSMRAMIGRLIGEDITVVLGLRSGLGSVLADRGQIEQIILNLSVNARDAMPNGGTLTIETRNVQLDESFARTHLATPPGPYVILTITDTGTGMTPEVQARVFEPFFTTKGTGRGTGLGLATVYGIVSRSGGSVSVYSEIDHGTSFNIYLPRADGAGIPAAVPASVADSDRGSETVLVVEDAEGLRELTREMLERRGYTVLVAENSAGAIRTFDVNPAIDLLLTDVVMPGGSGPDLVRNLVARRPSLKVIYMSGYTEDTMVRHGAHDSTIAFLHKPFTSDELGRKVRAVLDAKGAS